MSEALRLIVNGQRYGGWLSVRVTRSIESIAGSFDLGVTDRWGGQAEAWPIVEEDECQVKIDDATVIDGFIDRRSVALSGRDRTLSFAGRDRSAALVDCSVVLDKWTYRKLSALEVVKKLADPFGISVKVQPGLVLPKAPRKFVVSPGESAFAAIERTVKAAGVLVVSDGAGGIILTRGGTDRASALVEGENILAASVEYDAVDRFHRYVVDTQVGGTDTASGGATQIRGEATDEAIRRTDRVLLIRPESGMTADYARQRADWEARVRAARAETVTILVHGWLQSNGKLWPVNALVEVRCPAIGVKGDMLISQVEHSISESGKTTQLNLVRPDAFTAEPKLAKVKQSGGRWKELAKGAR